MDGLAAVRVAPDVRRGNVAGDIFEQINSGLVQVRDDLGGIFGFSFCIGPRHQVRRNDQAQGFRADARAIGDDEIAKAEQRFVLLLHGDVQERIGANDEKETIAVAVVAVTKVAHRVHRIVELRAAEILAGFGERRNEVRVFGTGKRNHGKPVREGREVLLQLVRRPARGDEVEFVEVEAPVGSAGDGKMAVVDGIEGAAENRNTARMVLCSSAVRLRGGQ